MANKSVIKVGKVAPALQKILDDYGRELSDVMLGPAADQAAESAREKLVATSPEQTGHYKGSWTVSHIQTKTKNRTIVHSATAYQRPHLLQFGHALRRGGRTIGQVGQKHDIASINDEAQEEYVKRFEELVRRGG